MEFTSDYDVESGVYCIIFKPFHQSNDSDVWYTPEFDSKDRMRLDWEGISPHDLIDELVFWLNKNISQCEEQLKTKKPMTRGEAFAKEDQAIVEAGGLDFCKAVAKDPSARYFSITKIDRNLNAKSGKSVWKIKARCTVGSNPPRDPRNITIKGDGICTNNVGETITVEGIKQ